MTQHINHNHSKPDFSKPDSSPDSSPDFERKTMGGEGDGPDPVPFEQFELVSAYLDNEVTENERHQVEHWLATDAKIQALYADLGGMTDCLKQAPVPLSASPEQVLAGVMAKMETRQRKRHRWGGAAIAAGLAATVGAISVGLRQPGLQFAQHGPLDPEADNGPLELAQSPTPVLDPVIDPVIDTVAASPDDGPILERALILE